jgi:hypothetical protein
MCNQAQQKLGAFVIRFELAYQLVALVYFFGELAASLNCARKAKRS